MTTLLAQRSFGGKSGTWFRKRKLKDAESNELSTTRSSSIVLFSLKEKNGSDLSKPTPKAERSRPSELERGASVVVGWDDVLCRPIYKDIKRESPKIGVASVSLQPKNLASKDHQEKPARVGMPPPKKRSYGRSRKERMVLNENCDTDRVEAPEKPSTTTTCDSVSHENEDQIVGESKEDSVFDFQESDKVGIPVTRKPKTCHTPPKETVQSVSSNTSLSVAKAFFSKLDSQHNLTISAAPSSISPTRKRSTGRTTRYVSSLTNRVLEEEYNEYTTACEDSAVTPLPKEAYIANRSSFFRSNAIYDGFLDE